MADDSGLDQKYFVTRDTFNCPFCSRRHVLFGVVSKTGFDWTWNKRCFIYTVECRSCRKTSMHLSYTDMPLAHEYGWSTGAQYRFEAFDGELDDKFFYSVPRTLFVMNERIPRDLREALDEAEGCLKSNFLTGASACARKVVYLLAKANDAEGESYEDRIKSLKLKLPAVDPSYFDTLVAIQDVTSKQVHENAYDAWSSSHVRLILLTLSEVLSEVYVIPELRRENAARVNELRREVLGTPSAEE